MKKIFCPTIVFFLFLLNVGLQAQAYHPLPDSNATWIVTTINSSGTFYNKYILSNVRDDTIINSKAYNKIFLNSPPMLFYAGAYRSDTNGKSYFVPYPAIDSTEYLLFDFSKNPGDTIKNVALTQMSTFFGAYDLKIDSAKLLNSGPYILKCFYLTPISPLPPYYNGNSIIWVEKIGSLNGGIFNEYLCGLNDIHLYGMCFNDTIYFSAPWDFTCYNMQQLQLSYDSGYIDMPTTSNEEIEPESTMKIYPNPFNQSTDISFDITYSDISLSIFDLLGKLTWQGEYSNCNSIKLERGGLENGIYILKIAIDKKYFISRKIVVRD